MYDKVAYQQQLEVLGPDSDKNTWCLHFIAVKPEYQGKGIAKALVKYVTDIV